MGASGSGFAIAPEPGHALDRRLALGGFAKFKAQRLTLKKSSKIPSLKRRQCRLKAAKDRSAAEPQSDWVNHG